MTHDKPYAVRLPKDAAKCVERDAKAQRLTLSDIIRRIIYKHYGLFNGAGEGKA